MLRWHYYNYIHSALFKRNFRSLFHGSFAIIKVDCLSDDKIIKETKHSNSAVKVTKLDSLKIRITECSKYQIPCLPCITNFAIKDLTTDVRDFKFRKCHHSLSALFFIKSLHSRSCVCLWLLNLLSRLCIYLIIICMLLLNLSILCQQNNAG